jgi:hypothetical protein
VWRLDLPQEEFTIESVGPAQAGPI